MTIKFEIIFFYNSYSANITEAKNYNAKAIAYEWSKTQRH